MPLVKNPPAYAGAITEAGREDPMKEEMATHSSILTWRNPGTEDPGGEGRRLQFMGSHRVGHD